MMLDEVRFDDQETLVEWNQSLIKIGELELKKEGEQPLGYKKILETEEWVAYKDYGWQQICEGEKTPKSNEIYLEHKNSGMLFTYGLPLFKDYNVDSTHNTITGEIVSCKFNGECCYDGEAEIKLSPHPDIPNEVVALHVKGSNIPAYNAITVSMGRVITEDEARLCYPMHCEDYSFFDGIKNLTDKAIGGVIENRASFGVINNSQSMHYIMAQLGGIHSGAAVVAYRCGDGFPCPDNRLMPPKSDEFTQYVFATEPNEEIMMHKTQEIVKEGGEADMVFDVIKPYQITRFDAPIEPSDERTLVNADWTFYNNGDATDYMRIYIDELQSDGSIIKTIAKWVTDHTDGQVSPGGPYTMIDSTSNNLDFSQRYEKGDDIYLGISIWGKNTEEKPSGPYSVVKGRVV